MSSARVVITGFGAVTTLGLTADDLWAGLSQGQCGINKIKSFDPVGFDCKLAGQVPDFEIKNYVPKTFRKATKLMSRDIELGIVATNDAIVRSGLVTKAIDPENVNVDPTRMAINFGAGLISCDLVELSPAVAASIRDGEFDIHKWGKDGLAMVTPLWLLKYLPNMIPCHIGLIHDIQGPSNTITCAEAAGQLAIIEASQVIARGSSDIAVAGGSEAKVNPIVMIRQCLNKRTTNQNNNDPSGACRPFDADAKGSVFGEGSAVVILENLETAKKRNAKIHAEIVGAGQSNNINPAYECLERDGKGIQIAIEKAIDQAGIEPGQLDLVIPHGTGIPADDLAESKAIASALGQAANDIPVFPTKSMISNTGAAAGAIDTVVAVCAMINKTIPAAKNCDKKAAGCNLNITKQSQQKDIHYVLCCSYSYGGQTAALVLKNFNG